MLFRHVTRWQPTLYTDSGGCRSRQFDGLSAIYTKHSAARQSPSIAAPENIDIGQPGLHIILTSLPAEPIGRLPQTDVAPVRPYQLLGLLLLLITILIKKEATFYEKDTY
ncbi:hypothetical protein A4W79_02720 [Latilactobacillus curvatus]|nr:hypothetical protein A4W79_02720 [Latilactobacillus curvatus]